MSSALQQIEPGAGIPVAGKGRHLPSLDGLRAISIGLVLLGHLNGTRHSFHRDLGIGDYAHLGVLVFFVISGFLITSLLLLEHAENGSISLRLFYARRAVRIFPASYSYLLCISLLWWAGVIHLRPSDLWHGVTYTVNYMLGPAWQVGHLWSLSIEEQFYLLWPFIVVGLKPRRAPWAAATAILIGPLARMAMWYFFRATPERDIPIFPVMADSLATGCLLAMMINWLEKQNWYLQLFRPSLSILLALSVLAINRYEGYTIVAVFGTSLINVILAVLIHRSVYRHRDAFGRVLNWRPVALVGTLSYSLYVWQQLFINPHSTSWMNAFPQNLVAAIAAAVASYFLLEKPLLRLRSRLRSY